MPTFDFNLDFNTSLDFNVNGGTPGSSVGGNGPRVRANTEDFRKWVALGAVVAPANAASMRFPAYWDAELRAYTYLNDFLIGFPTWRQTLQADLGSSGAPPNLTSPHTFASGLLRDEILDLLDRAPDRPDRFGEIVGQHGGEGAISYFLGMLMIDPARMPATHLLMRVARRLGEHVSMCLKDEFRCPRPSQLCAAIVPMIDPPATPAFPSGHSLQAALIARCLEATSPPHEPVQSPSFVERLALRIGENRIIAGLHFRQDHIIGAAIGRWLFTRFLSPLGSTTPFKRLLTAATGEMTQQWADQP